MLELDPDAEWSQEGPSLSNDIWKKFELILTPPRSPLRETDIDLLSPFPGKDMFNLKTEGMDFDIDFGNTLEMPLLEEDDLYFDLDSIDLDNNLPYDLPGGGPVGLPCTHGLGRGTCTSCTQLALAGSELRHDCMWVGTCTAEAHNHSHYRRPRIHKDSGSQITELLMECSSTVLEGAAGFTHITDLDCTDSGDSHLDVAETSLHQQFSGNHIARPDTPSESSETDTDEDIDHYDDDDDECPRGEELYGVCHEEEVYTSETPTSSGIVHVDHSYHCVRIPSPTPTASSSTSPSHYNRSSLLHTPSDSEDEIDVVSVKSPDRAHTGTSRSTSKRYGDTTFIATTTSGGMKKIVKVRTGTLPAKPSRRMRKQLQQAMAAGVKRRTNGASGHNSVVLLRKAGVSTSSLKTPKRLQRSLGSRKRRAPKSDSDDPEKRQMHNSLERMRRVDLRNAFEYLRVLVPELSDREKAPKVEILKKASDHCHGVSVKEQTLMHEKERHKRYHNDLRKRLLALQRQLR
ncbi:myc proto-oncogene protein-like isoform X2 [Homarus americanus]|nr:myc proto-oncogene protein-like isoform X2 [Homarus americanus]